MEKSKIYYCKQFMQGGKPFISGLNCVIFKQDGGAIAISNCIMMNAKYIQEGNGGITLSTPIGIFNFIKYENSENLYGYGIELEMIFDGGAFSWKEINDNPKFPLESHITEKYGVVQRFQSRVSDDYIEFLKAKKPQKFLEIGVAYGNYSKFLLDKLDFKETHLLDCWRELEGVSDFYSNSNLVDALENATEKFQEKKGVKFFIGTIQEKIEYLEEKSYDMIYVDADHTFEGCYRDLIFSEKLIKEDGYICGHDYTKEFKGGGEKVMNDYGVVEAVDKFCKEYGWELIALTIEVPEWCFPSYVLKKKNK